MKTLNDYLAMSYRMEIVEDKLLTRICSLSKDLRFDEEVTS
jgi:hypothetical protein